MRLAIRRGLKLTDRCKVDALHNLFVALVNLKDDARVAVAIVGVDAGGDANAAEVAVLIKRHHGLAGLLDLLFAEAVADLMTLTPSPCGSAKMRTLATSPVAKRVFTSSSAARSE